jgi:hypothetical protein
MMMNTRIARKTLPFVLALALALSLTGIVLAASDPNHVSFTFQGCRNPSVDLETTNFICADGDYTNGNLGKTWNELDLVPHRVTTSLGTQAAATTEYTFAIVADHIDAAKFGYDFISVPTVNAAKSDASCSISAGALQTVSPGIGGTDTSMYRLVTVTQDKGTTCVFDYYERLALGAAQYPGSSLHSNLTNQLLGTQGIGAQDISIPVKEILPQELDKEMTASRDADHVWTITKSPTPATLSFPNTCDPSNPTNLGVEIKVEWERLPASPSGDVTIITKIYATNPSHRTITVDVTDQVYEGTDQTVPVGAPATSGPVDVPANTANFLVLTHQFTTASSAAHFNDVATATYTDKVTGIPVPGQTQAQAEADVQTGTTTNTTATINDVESITGMNFSYSADSFSGALGAFDGGYVAGTPTTGSVSWTSDTQSDSGSVTFDKTVYVSAPVSSSATLDDTATLNASDGFSADFDATVHISASFQVTLTINKTIPNVLTGAETQTFTFEVKDSSDVVVATPSITFSAGETSKSVDVSGLEPDTYTVSEDPATGWDAQADKSANLSETCAGSVTFNNDFSPASAEVKKVTIPAGEEAGWEFTLNGPGGPETVTTTGAGFIAFTTELQEGNYTITETPQAGWDNTGSSGDCSFTVDYPADAGKVFSCTFENTKRGNIIVDKVTDPAGDSQSFDFTASYGNFSLTDADPPHDSGPLVPGSYSVSETVPEGWDLTSATCDNGDDPSSITLGAGETITCTFENTKRGTVTVIKTFQGQSITGSETFEFQLREGASTLSDGTVLDTKIADSNNGGTIQFEVNGTTQLVPGDYQLCEFIMAGWDSSIRTMAGAFVPNSLSDPATTDNAYVCVPFTLNPGESEVFNIDNTPPPGGMAKTIGFWKNWSSCSGGRQDPILDETLASFSGGGVLIGDLFVDTCQEATRILDKSKVNNGKKTSNDAAYGLAAQLLAAQLNVQAGAGACTAATDAITAGQMLLDQINFNGTGDYLGPKVKGPTLTLRNQALALANTLDQYNNNLLCP